MDPLSIATGAVTLASTAVSLSKAIYTLVRGVKEADNDLQALAEELRAVSVSLESVGKALKNPTLAESFKGFGLREESEKRLAHIEQIIESCRHILGQLEDLVKQVTGSNTTGNTSIRKFATALKLKFKQADLKQIRERLKSFRDVLQLELQTIDLEHSVTTNATVKEISALVATLSEQLLNLRLDFKARTEREDSSLNVLDNNESKSFQLRRYLDSVESTIASVSVYCGSTRGTFREDDSVIDLGSEGIREVEEWLEDTRAELKGDQFSQSSPQESLNGSSSDEMQSFLQHCKREIDRNLLFSTPNAFNRAISLSGAYLQLVETDSSSNHAELFRAKMKLGFARMGQGSLSVAKGLYESLLEVDKSQSWNENIHFLLADIHFRLQNFQNAEEYGRSALEIYQYRFGKRSEQFCYSIALLVNVFEATGASALAAEYRLQSPFNQSPYHPLEWSTIPFPSNPSDVFPLRLCILHDLCPEDPNVKDSTGRTMLHYAAWYGFTDTVAFLLSERDADPNILAKDGQSALAFAAFRGEGEIVDLLCKHGADPNSSGPSRRSPLVLAAMEGRASIVRSLIGAGAHADATNKVGSTALIYAAWRGKIDSVVALLERGAKIDKVDRLQGTALTTALYYRQPKIAESLLYSGADPNLCGEGTRPLIAASRRGYLDLVQDLLDNGANPNLYDCEGFTALMAAALMGHAPVVKTLLQCGADADLRDKRGRATRSSTADYWPADLQRLSAQDESHIALDYAKCGNSSQRRETIQMLEDHQHRKAHYDTLPGS